MLTLTPFGSTFDSVGLLDTIRALDEVSTGLKGEILILIWSLLETHA